MTETRELKAGVREFWNEKSCGEDYAVGATPREAYEAQYEARKRLEPYIEEFARFSEGRDRDVLEIGVGLGADHVAWARSRPRTLSGVDLTPRAIEHVARRLALFGLASRLQVADAEALPFDDASFDIVYSWGVIHHTPDTPRAVEEVRRVLRPGGRARIMVYHAASIVGLLLWTRYALLEGHPGLSLASIYAAHLESPGTKAYSVTDGRRLFERFATVSTRIQLSPGDLLDGVAGERHGGRLMALARRVWPRRMIKALLPRRGLYLLIEATK